MTSLALVAPPTPAEATLAQLHDLRAELAEAVDIPAGLDLVNRADAISAWVRIARLRGEVAIEAGELHVRAQRRLGELLRDHQVATGRRRVTFATYGVSTKHSSRSQLIARIPAPEFDQRMAACRSAGKVPNVESFVRAANRFARPIPKRVTPTLSLLARALRAIREVRTLSTPKEVAAAREIARVARGWLAQVEDLERSVQPVRTTSCLLCGRSAPNPLPPRCQICNGAWFTA